MQGFRGLHIVGNEQTHRMRRHTYLSAVIPCCWSTWIALNGSSEETPPKQVKLTELEASRCLRRSLLAPACATGRRASSKSQVTVMRGFSHGESRGEQLRPGQAVLLEMLREFLETLIEIRGSISTCSMRAIELTARTFPFSMPVTSFITLRAVFSAAPLLEHQRHILILRQLYAAKMQDLGAPEAHFGQEMRNPLGARALHSPRCADRPNKRHRLL